MHKIIESYDEYLNEQLDSRIRSKIVVDLKNSGFKLNSDFRLSGTTFIAKDTETASKIEAELSTEYSVIVHYERKISGKEVPLSISTMRGSKQLELFNGEI